MAGGAGKSSIVVVSRDTPTAERKEQFFFALE
jgi:hypothetical protein